MQENPQEDGYVECSECGHTIDSHNEEGCTETDGVNDCTCEVYWTRTEVRAYYQCGRCSGPHQYRQGLGSVMMTTDELWNAHADEMLFEQDTAFRVALQDEAEALGLDEDALTGLYIRLSNKAGGTMQRIRNAEKEI